jgi:tetratricopeptide (TPR) repeat protein
MTARKTSAYLIGLLASTLALYSCATQPVVEEKKPEPAAVRITPEEQQQKALEAYNDLVEITADVDRRAVLPQLKEGHLRVIRDYPDSSFAEESYLRLIMISFEDYEVPQFEEAEKYYREYFKSYPKPRLDNAINEAMARYYYRYGLWERLANFLTPQIEKYVRTGESPGPFYLFIYTEALFYLKDYKEAEKGYLTVIRLYPGSHEAKIAADKLKTIEALKAGGEEKK